MRQNKINSVETILNLRQGGGNKVNVLVHSFLQYCKKCKKLWAKDRWLKAETSQWMSTIRLHVIRRRFRKKMENVNIFLRRFVIEISKLFKWYCQKVLGNNNNNNNNFDGYIHRLSFFILVIAMNTAHVNFRNYVSQWYGVLIKRNFKGVIKQYI